MFHKLFVKLAKGLSFLIILILPVQVQSATLYANGSCGNDGDGTVSGCAVAEGGVGARRTVQAAIDQASGGDTVKVVPYNYGTPSRYTVYYENLVVSKEITLEADTSTLPSSGPPTAYWTTIDGDETNDRVGDNGNATVSWTGGVGGTLRNLKIEGGYSSVSGGMGSGVMIGGEGTDVVLTGLMVRYNDNGIVVRYGASPFIKGNIIYFNDKSGVVVRDSSSPTIGGGDCGGTPQSCADADANRIYRNSRRMTTVQCFGGGYGDCERERDEGCAAITVLDASSPKIWGNKVYANYFTGIASLGRSAPSIKWNYIRGNGSAGVGLLSAGQAITVSKNWFEKNKRGIGVQSSGDPCAAITITDNDIVNHTHDGISSCNAYVKIGGQSGDGNRVYNNKNNGIFLSLASYGEISYNNILNNYESGVRVFGSEATIENNLIADNGCGLSANNPCLSNGSREYGQIDVVGGTVRGISNNLIVGGNDSGTGYEGLGVLLYESLLFQNTPVTIQEIKDNIIFRVSQGVKLREDQGYGTVSGYRPGAVDRNLVMAWDDGLYSSAYDLGGSNLPGEGTYYYGQESGSYGSGPDFFLSDPNHLTDTVVASCGANVNAKCPDYKVAYDPDSPLYNINSLGLPSDFVYIDQSGTFAYRFSNSDSPASDSSAPVVDRIVPPDGAGNVSRAQKIMAYLKDSGDGVDSGTVELSIVGVGGCSPGATPCVTSGDASYLRVEYQPATLLSNTLYTINIIAADARSNSLSATTTFTTNGTEANPPTIADQSPADGVSDVAANTAIEFKVRDSESGVDPDTIALRVDGGLVTADKAPISGGSGVTPDYNVYYKPPGSFSAGATVNLHIYAEDFDSNIYSAASSFTVSNDTVAPKDVSKLSARIKSASAIKLSWIPSENLDCDIHSFPYKLYTDSGGGYDSGSDLSGLPYSADNYTVTNLSEGGYSFKLTVKDKSGNPSAGTEISNIQLAASSEFSDDFEGFYDDFSGDLSKWSQSGASTWQISGGELRVSGDAGELTINNLERADYRYQAAVKITSAAAGDAAWLLVRKTPGNELGTSGYAAMIGLGSSDNIAIYELSATGASLIASGGYTISGGQFYDVALTVESNIIRLTVDNSLTITGVDSNNSFLGGAAGIWQPAGNGDISYDNIKIDYNKNGGGIYQYSAGQDSWLHTNSGGVYPDSLLYSGGGTAGELLINPLVLGDTFQFKSKFKIPAGSGGSLGLLARKAAGSSVGSSGYLLDISAGTTGNINLYRLPSTLMDSGAYTINPGQDYWVWLVGQANGSYQVRLSNSNLYSEGRSVFSPAPVDETYSNNSGAGFYGSGSDRVRYDDIFVSADLSAIGASVTVNSAMSYSTIQSTIDNANPGDTVIFSSGAYDIGKETFNMKEGVSLKAKSIGACGAKTVTVRGTNILIRAADAASIEGFKLAGNTSNVGISAANVSTTIENNEIVSCYDGIRVGGTNLTAPSIKNNCIHHNARHGIGNSFGATPLISDNTIYNNGKHGIGNDFESAPQIRGNTIYNNSEHGIGNSGDSYATISGNNIYQNIKHGIGVKSSAYPTIENNYIYSNLQNGVAVGCDTADNPACQTDARPVISNNKIYSNLYSGIAVRSQARPTISSNEIYNHIYTCMGVGCADSEHSFGAGIRFYGNAQPVIATNNNIHSNSYGISMNLEATNQLIFSGFSISGNGIGLHIGGDSAVTVANCTLSSNYKLGIGMYHTAHPVIRNNQIRRNGDAAGRAGDILKFMQGAASGVGGIGLAVSSYPTIRDNNIWGHSAEILISDDTLSTQSDLTGQPTKVRLGAGASNSDNYYKGRSIYLLTGDGDPEVTYIDSYEGATRIATLSSSYAVKPLQGDRYRIFRENYGIGIRGLTRATAASIHDNQVHSNYLGIALGGRDDPYTDTPNANIYSNTIYGNGSSDCPVDINGLSCGGGIGNRAASAANIYNNDIYNNTRYGNFGIGIKESASPTITNNDIYSNALGVGMYRAGGTINISGNTIKDNGIYTSNRMQAGGIGINELTGTVNIDNNTIASSQGSGPAAGGIGMRNLDGGTVNIGTTTGNVIRNNSGGQEAGELRCGGIGGRYDTANGGTVTISQNQIYGNNNGGIGLDDFEHTAFVISNNNQIHHNDKGIRSRNVADLTISNNQIYSIGDGTQANPPTTLPDGGITIRRDADEPFPVAINTTITSNTITDNNGGGIYLTDLQAGDTVNILGNTIGGAGGLGNTMTGIGIGKFSLTPAGVINIGNGTAVGRNYIRNNGGSATGLAGGIAVNDFGGTVTINMNTITSNTGVNAPGGIGCQGETKSPSFTIANNTITGNAGDTRRPGIAMGNLGGGGTITIGPDNVVSDGIIFSNSAGQAVTITENTSIGSIGINGLSSTLITSNTAITGGIACDGNTSLTIRNNPSITGIAPDTSANVTATIVVLNLTNLTVSGNAEINGRGITFRDLSGNVDISDNGLISGTGHTSQYSPEKNGVIIGRVVSGTTTISNNVISLSDTYVSSASGISLMNNADSTIGSNIIRATAGGAGHFGIELDSSGSNTVITSNDIRNFNRSGLRAKDFTGVDDIIIRNNIIYSCGMADYFDPATGYRYASGIQLLDSHISTNGLIDNDIKYNKFSGIAAYASDGYIGPNNTIRYNGNSQDLGCSGLNGPGSGDGGVAVRNLALGDTLIVSGNTIADNNIGSLTCKDSNGTARLDGTDVSCSGGYWDMTQAKVYVDSNGVYVDGVKKRSDGIVDCANDPDIPDNVSGGAVWGIAVDGGTSGVVVRNCNVYANNTSANNYGPGGSNMGGGVFVGPNVDAQIYSNNIYNNGCETPSAGNGGSAGIVTRCSSSSAVFRNNDIYSNLGDGINGKGSAAAMGQLNAGNKIYSNGRFGVGLSGGGSPNVGYNNIYQNSSGGVGGYQFSGTATIHDNSIYSNTGSTLSEAAGIGLKNLSGTANISNNIIRNNVYTSSYDYPAGIGIYLPLGGSVAIDNNIIASNRAHSASNVGGIGLRGLSSSSYSAIGDVSITSNRINNHLYAAGGDQAGIAFEYLDFNGASMIIRNNDKDGIGISDNASGVRFRYIKNAATVTVSDNTINSNYCDWTTGGVGVEFRNCATLSIDVDNNIMSNNHFSGSGSTAGVIAFEYCQLYSGNYIKIRRNHINNTDANGMEFRYVGGYDNTHVAHLYIGTDAEAPGTSNNIINIAANRNAIRFEDNTYGDGIEMNILNNNNLEGGISFRDSELTALNIIDNANIYDGGVPGGMGGMSGVCKAGMGMPDWDASGIQGKINTYGGHNGVMPVVIRNNGIRNNNRLGIFVPVYNETGNVTMTIENNTLESNGWAGFFNPSGSSSCMNTFIFSGNTVYNNGLVGDTDPGYDSDGVVMRNLSSSIGARFTDNTVYSNKVNGLSLRACDNVTVSGGEYYDNGIRGIGARDYGSVVVEKVKSYNNGHLGISSYWAGMGFDTGTATVKNCFVYRNNRIGIGSDGATVNVYFTTVVNNANYGLREDAGTITAKDCILWGNSDDNYRAAVTYSDIEDGDSGTGNISQNPVFVDAVNDNYHIQSGPCIDAGTDVGIYTDYDGDSRPQGGGYDMGADECPSCTP